MTMHRVRASAAGAALVFVGLASSAAAQTDHLKCYKVKADSTFKQATADFHVRQLQFVGENCSFKGKVAQLCVPASKTNVVIENGSIQDVPSEALANAQICYKAKCLDTTSVGVEVSDQFGTRTVTKGKVSKVCGPAFEN